VIRTDQRTTGRQTAACRKIDTLAILACIEDVGRNKEPACLRLKPTLRMAS